jgi:K+-sensing histidine kinase KdpD
MRVLIIEDEVKMVALLRRGLVDFSHPDNVRTGRSAGLGLAIVATIAHAHGGTATATNTHPNGSNVHITLPHEHVDTKSPAKPLLTNHVASD